MEKKKGRKTYVVGHKNPDTDSICSAIAYANLKREITGGRYVAMRAGELNGETTYVLNKFGVKAPEILENIYLRVKDVDLGMVEGASGEMSIKDAWQKMKDVNTKTLPIVQDGKLEGLITIGDIATSYMDVHESHTLSVANTKYANIIRTLDGELVVGDENAYFSSGKVTIAASSPELMEEFIEKDDLVILGNRYEAQLCAIELEAACLVICQGAKVSRTIKKMAEERGITIIQTPFDTFNVSRLINQSIPIKFFMTKGKLATFRLTDYIEDIKVEMTKQKFRDFPIVDNKGKFCGFLSRRRLLSAHKRRAILVDHNESSQAVDGIEEAEIVEIIDHHKLGDLETNAPVYFRNQPVGCTATIVYKLYQENKVKLSSTMAALLCSAILSDTLLFRSPTCTKEDQAAAEHLAEIAGIDMETHAKEMFNAGSNLQNKTVEEICFQDYKVFNTNGLIYGVGQITSMNQSELDAVKERLVSYLVEARNTQRLDMVYIILTNILEEESEVLCSDAEAKLNLIEAFELPKETERILLKGVVSRKKQFIPTFTSYLQQK